MHERSRLWNRNFSLLWQGQFISSVGTHLSQVALVLWLYQVTDSSAGIGLLLMLSSIPGVLLGPFAGALCDRLSRKAILVVCDALQGMLCVALAGMLWIGAAPFGLLAAVFAVHVLAAVVDVLFFSAATAAVPDLVPNDRVEAANSWNSSANEIAKLLGQGAGGVLFGLVGIPLLLVLDGLTYLYAAASELFLQLPPCPRREELSSSIQAIVGRTVADVREGIRFVTHSGGRWQLLGIAGVLNFFIVPLFVVLPELVAKELKAGEAWYGYSMAAMGLGSLLGAMMAGVLNLGGRERGTSLICGLPLIGLLMILSGCSASPGMLAAATLALGLVLGFVNVPIRTLLQTTTPRELRGRVFGLQQMLTGGLAPLGYGTCCLVVAWLRGHPNALPQSLGIASAVLMSSGAAVSLIAVAAVFNAAYRAFLSTENALPCPGNSLQQLTSQGTAAQ